MGALGRLLCGGHLVLGIRGQERTTCEVSTARPVQGAGGGHNEAGCTEGPEPHHRVLEDPALDPKSSERTRSSTTQWGTKNRPVGLLSQRRSGAEVGEGSRSPGTGRRRFFQGGGAGSEEPSEMRTYEELTEPADGQQDTERGTPCHVYQDKRVRTGWGGGWNVGSGHAEPMTRYRSQGQGREGGGRGGQRWAQTWASPARLQ